MKANEDSVTVKMPRQMVEAVLESLRREPTGDDATAWLESTLTKALVPVPSTFFAQRPRTRRQEREWAYRVAILQDSDPGLKIIRDCAVRVRVRVPCCGVPVNDEHAHCCEPGQLAYKEVAVFDGRWVSAYVCEDCLAEVEG